MKRIIRNILIGIPLLSLMISIPWGLNPAYAGPGGGTWYANSPAPTAAGVANASGTPIRKFVDRMPGLGLPNCTLGTPLGGAGSTCNENALGQYIPIAQADTGTYTGSDYYVIGLKDFRQRMHTDLFVTNDALGSGTKLRGYYQINAADTKLQTPQYLGPLILATRDKPVRILFQNMLGTGAAGNLFLPVDTTVMGAGTGGLGTAELHTENRATVHLHGGHSPWISDGTPHQWITPAGDPTNYKKGLSFQNVPDMIGTGKSIPAPAANDGKGTFYYTNQQSGRLMFYHDHAYGITRLNVYAGEAAGYLITDAQEEALITARDIPNICAGSETVPGTLCEYKYGIPLVIQDKTFVPANVATQDSLWTWGAQGDLWFPHVYEPAQNPASPDGLNPMGRWDYGPYVWPPSPVTNPTLPTLSIVPEGFMDTPVVNGTAYPYLDVQPKAYRFRILSVANDRSFNLQLYYGANAAGTVCNNNVTPAGTCTEVNMVPAVPRPACSSTAPIVLTNCVCSPGAGNSPAGCFPATYPTDGRDGGVPDPATAGPQMIVIGTESGFLPQPVTLPNQPITFSPVGNVANKTLLLMPAERADVLIDFSLVPQGSTLILYNDAPAALPGGDPRYDYYTGNQDQTAAGGALSTAAGFGPNTRTIMQFRVTNAAATAPVTTVNTATLPAALATAYTAQQPAHIVPANTYAKLTDTSMTVNGVNIPFKGKSINEGFDATYGRINAMLGIEDPSGLTPSMPLEYAAAPTEILGNDRVQLWKITHNGVDSHPIHFHLTDVQVVNRMGWDGSIRPPDPIEMGWKETVRMNPLEDILVAMRPTLPQVPFSLPNNIRPIDVLFPVSATNPLQNFGHEYAWHCHILGHEEYDLMRPLVLNVDGLLYVKRTGAGIWQWELGTWTQITTTDPTDMVASGANLYASFPGTYGLGKWDGNAWSQLTTTIPASMVASGSTLYATFPGTYGLGKWDGTAWSQLTTVVPSSMVASGTDLYASFPGTYGLGKWNGTAWSQLTPASPSIMVASGTNLYASFAGEYGLGKWNGTAWSQLTEAAPTSMVASGTDLYASFSGEYGLGKWNGTAWSQLTPTVPASMVASGSALYASFPGTYGLGKWDGTAWSQVSTVAPGSMVGSGSVLYADFPGTYGLGKWELNAWNQLSTIDPSLMVTGF